MSSRFCIKFCFINFNTFSFKLVLQNKFSHSNLYNRVNCEKQILPSVGFEKLFSKTNLKLKVLKLIKSKNNDE